MKAGLIGAVAIGGAVAAVLTWTDLATVQPDRPAEPPAGRPASGAPDTPARDAAAPASGGGRPPAAPTPGPIPGTAPGPPPGVGGAVPVPQSDGPAVAPEITTSANPVPAPDSGTASPGRTGDVAALAPATESVPSRGGAADRAAPEPTRVPLAPSFDIVRVDADGQTVIAGRSEPNQRVEVLLDGKVVETALATSSGRFVAILSTEPSSTARELRLRVALPGLSPSAGVDEAVAPTAGAGGRATAAIPPDTPPDGAAPSRAAPGSPAAGGGPGSLAGTRPDGTASIPSGAASPAAPPDPPGGPDGEPAPAPDDAAAASAAPAPGPAPGPPADGGGERYLLSDAVIILPTERPGTAPALVQVQDDALALLQPGGADATGVVLDQLTRSPGGDLLLRGRARPGHAVRIYGNGKPIETVPVDDGGWRLTVPGSRADAIRLFRLDEIARSGAVASRVEVPFQPSDAASQVVRDRRITVRRGDNLWRIAEQHYGEGIRYSLIFGANGDLIRDPDLIYPDQVFTIPELVEAE